MTKKLLAINNETGERIEFDVGDIYACFDDKYKCSYIAIDAYNFKSNLCTRTSHTLKDHTLYYLHEGIYYNYETGKEMV